jgi:hypothetical protein
MRKIVLSIAPKPAIPTPHHCGPPWAIECGCGHRWPLTRPSRSVHMGGTGTGRAGLCRWSAGIVVVYPPTATKEGAHPSAHHLIPAPRRAQVTFFAHLLQLGCQHLYASFRRCRYTVFFIFSRRCKSCAKKATAKETSPIIRASNSLLCSPIAAKEKRNATDL